MICICTASCLSYCFPFSLFFSLQMNWLLIYSIQNEYNCMSPTERRASSRQNSSQQLRCWAPFPRPRDWERAKRAAEEGQRILDSILLVDSPGLMESHFPQDSTAADCSHCAFETPARLDCLLISMESVNFSAFSIRVTFVQLAITCCKSLHSLEPFCILYI